MKKLGGEHGLKKIVVDGYLGLGGHVMTEHHTAEHAPPWERLPYGVLDAAVGAKIRHEVGLDRAKVLITAAAPIHPDLIRWFHAIGVPVDRAVRPDRGVRPDHLQPAHRQPGRHRRPAHPRRPRAHRRRRRDPGQGRQRLPGLLPRPDRDRGADRSRRLDALGRRRRARRRRLPAHHRAQEGPHHHRGGPEHHAAGDRDGPALPRADLGSDRDRRGTALPHRAR